MPTCTEIKTMKAHNAEKTCVCRECCRVRLDKTPCTCEDCETEKAERRAFMRMSRNWARPRYRAPRANRHMNGCLAAPVPHLY